MLGLHVTETPREEGLRGPQRERLFMLSPLPHVLIQTLPMAGREGKWSSAGASGPVCT